TSPFYTSDPAFKAMADGYIALGTAFMGDHDKVKTADLVASQARSTRDNGRISLDGAYDTLVTGVMGRALTLEDIHACGFGTVSVEVVSQTIALPSDIQLRYDPKALAILVHVKWATKGRHQCILEISPDPIGPATWKRLDTSGVKVKL